MGAGLIVLGIGFTGFILGSLTVLTMPTPAGYRVVAIASVVVATCFGLSLVFGGAVTDLGPALLIPFFAPTVTALAARAFLQARYERSEKSKRA